MMERPHNGLQFINCHMAFEEVKMKEFKRMTCPVAGDHMSQATDTNTYSGVIAYKTLCIALTVMVLNDLEVKAAGVLNNFVTAFKKEKIWMALVLG